MLRCHSESFKSSVKLVDGLRLSTKEELKDMAQLLLLPIPSKLRKEEYVSCLAEAVLTCPDIWISQLTHYEWVLLQKLVKAGANTYVEEPNMIMTCTLELLSFVATERNCLNGDKIRYMICDELREAVAPHIDKFLTSTEENSRFVLEQYALGILNLYGLLPYTEFLKQLTGYLKGSMTKDEIAAGLSNSMLMRLLTFDMEDIYSTTMYVRSPLLLDVEDLEERLYMHRGIKSLKKFTVEEVLSAGTMPAFYISNPHSDELKGFMMRKLGYNEELAEAKIQWLWYAIQMNENPMSAIVSAIDTKVLSMQELQEVVGIAVNYCNDCSRWFLKGYSSTEASALLGRGESVKTPPRIVAGPAMKAAGMDITPEMQTMVDGMFYDRFSGTKIGRNDPCPCGSGKKYKKCCGRDN